LRRPRRRQDQRARRTLRRKQGTAWRILPDRRARSRCGTVLGVPLSGRCPRRHRGAAGLGDVDRLPMPRENDAVKTAEAVARRSYGKLVAFLAARTHDVAAAEDALSEAFAAALADWPRALPDNPEAWLLTVARRKFIDTARRRRSGEAAVPHLQLTTEELESVAASRSDIPDQRLALMFACAHPAIEPAIRAPLILQTILGFDAAAIASAFLISPAAMGQRLTRAKSK